VTRPHLPRRPATGRPNKSATVNIDDLRLPRPGGSSPNGEARPRPARALKHSGPHPISACWCPARGRRKARWCVPCARPATGQLDGRGGRAAPRQAQERVVGVPPCATARVLLMTDVDALLPAISGPPSPYQLSSSRVAHAVAQGVRSSPPPAVPDGLDPRLRRPTCAIASSAEPARRRRPQATASRCCSRRASEEVNLDESRRTPGFRSSPTLAALVAGGSSAGGARPHGRQAADVDTETDRQHDGIGRCPAGHEEVWVGW